MTAKDPARAYHKGVEALQRAETAFQGAMDAVQAARTAERWSDVPGLRKAAERAEHALDDALAAAQRAHREYWIARRTAEAPNLRAAALAFRRFVVIARCAGDSTPQARGAFDALAAEVTADEADPSEDVPVEPPDSDLQWSQRDPAWKPRY